MPAPEPNSPRTRRPRRASKSRTEIVDAICAVIAERGYENTRFSDVALEAATSISSLQYMFGSREDMIVVALEERVAQYLQTARTFSQSETDPLRRLRGVATYLAAGLQDDESRHEWLIWTEYWRAALRDDGLRDSSRAAYEDWVGLVRDAVAACVSEGACPPPDDIEEVATGAVALGDGLGIQIALRHSTMTVDRAASVMRQWLALRLSCPALQSIPARRP